MDMLQKITYLVLPAQNAFKGVNVASVDRAGNIHFR
jgi:ribosomal protein L5